MFLLVVAAFHGDRSPFSYMRGHLFFCQRTQTGDLHQDKSLFKQLRRLNQGRYIKVYTTRKSMQFLSQPTVIHAHTVTKNLHTANFLALMYTFVHTYLHIHKQHVSINSHTVIHVTPRLEFSAAILSWRGLGDARRHAESSCTLRFSKSFLQDKDRIER